MGARCRLSVDVGYVGVEGERDVIDKQFVQRPCEM